ncbi:UNVERIFIED_CONTAM: ABC transporter C family member 3 [Sesamum radiatum]|uniref:ABC-type xenobiotic transporter n=1 Tax=Sesamum radiatum TaxID=300843 RepID=A0AAW2KHD3_SESRA
MGIPLESGKILSALATFRILQDPIYSLPGLISMIVQTKVSLDRVASFLSLDELQPDVVEKLPKLSGTVRVSGTKAYVAQSPWIRGGTIEENILFCKEMDRERYNRVLGACSLKKDLEILAFGDQTIIGERGINLSGGQKQRVQIARVYLGLLDSKTVVYVTHQVEFLPAADIILVMRDGKINQIGKYGDILKSGSDFKKLVGAHEEAMSAIGSTEVRKSASPEGSRDAYANKLPEEQGSQDASTDQSTVDLDLAYLVGQFAFAIIQLLGIIGVVSQVAWQVFFIFIPVLAICIWLEKSCVTQHCLFCSNITYRQDENWLDYVGCTKLQYLDLSTKRNSDPSIAGLAVTYGLSLNALQSWIVWTLSNMETKIISVERILQYSSIPSEPPLVVESNRPQSHWPTHGEVSIQNLQVRYAPHMPLVLRGLTCTFFGEKKTGIVGRTGSGKSTLIQTLFRIVEPTGGQILIDGINILSIGLHDLRSRLSIIPQEPTMFEGTVRSNLDPLEEYTDEQIWELGDKVREKQGKLDSSVSENGENWSVGQRQLVCLGRVLLKKSKILVLDEATASVDTATDNLIQQTLKQHFSNSTVITIAHRITSVLDSTMVLILDNGRLKEYDSPDKLLEDKSSFFAKLVAEYSMRSSSSR